jgi:hypothetical protein
MRSKDTKEEINLGTWDLGNLEAVVKKAYQINQTGRKIDFISRQFLGTQYAEDTLIGSERTYEMLVVNFSKMDCFTFIDYVEALRLSNSFPAFKNNLTHVRYRSGIIAFDHRNHFFSDWISYGKDRIGDVTKKIGGTHTQSARKILNKKENGTLYLPGIAPVERIIHYIPGSILNEAVMRKLKAGDYVGIYTDNPGLDVTHVGIIIKSKNTTYLRHASSLPEFRKVVDQEFKDYVADRPGFLVLRPREKKIVES